MDIQCKIKRILFRSIISPPIYLGKLEKRADISPASRHVIAEVHTFDQNTNGSKTKIAHLPYLKTGLYLFTMIMMTLAAGRPESRLVN